VVGEGGTQKDLPPGKESPEERPHMSRGSPESQNAPEEVENRQKKGGDRRERLPPRRADRGHPKTRNEKLCLVSKGPPPHWKGRQIAVKRVWNSERRIEARHPGGKTVKPGEKTGLCRSRRKKGELKVALSHKVGVKTSIGKSGEHKKDASTFRKKRSERGKKRAGGKKA